MPWVCLFLFLHTSFEGGRHPLCGIGVTSRMKPECHSIPLLRMARNAASLLATWTLFSHNFCSLHTLLNHSTNSMKCRSLSSLGLFLWILKYQLGPIKTNPPTPRTSVTVPKVLFHLGTSMNNSIFDSTPIPTWTYTPIPTWTYTPIPTWTHSLYSIAFFHQFSEKYINKKSMERNDKEISDIPTKISFICWYSKISFICVHSLSGYFEEGLNLSLFMSWIGTNKSLEFLRAYGLEPDERNPSRLIFQKGGIPILQEPISMIWIMLGP